MAQAGRLDLSGSPQLATLDGRQEPAIGSVLDQTYVPRPCLQWRLHHSEAAASDEVMLEQVALGHFLRLGARGRFIWEHLDGKRSLQDLRQRYQQQYGENDDGLIDALLTGLAQQGFLQSETAPQRALAAEWSPVGLAHLAHRVLTATVVVEPFDPLLTALYRRVRPFCYTPIALLFWAIVAVGGTAAFLTLWLDHRMVVTTGGSAGWVVPLLLLIGWFTHMPLLEMQHALAAKHLGRQVRRAGFGWFWFVPVCWVDTSAMWPASRRERLIVDAAGPFASLALGGALSLLVILLPLGSLRTGLFDVALLVYAGLLGSLNPLLENDGYYVLQDLLQTSGLRARALRYIATCRQPGARGPVSVEQRGYLLYVLFGVLYLIVASWQIVVLYRAHIESLLSSHMPEFAADALGWLLPCLFVVGVILGMSHEVIASQEAQCPELEILERRINK